MVHPCDKPCGNKTASGYCATTACINPKYSNYGTAQYGQGVQKRIVTNADRIRDMTDEELARLFADENCGYCRIHDFCFAKGCQIDCEDMWLDWLKQEVSTNG